MQSTNQFLLIPPTSILSKVFVFLQDTHSSPSPCTPSFFQHLVHATVHKRATCTRSAVFLFDLSQHHCHWCSFNLHVCISSLQCGTSNRVHFLLEPCPRDGFITTLLDMVVVRDCSCIHEQFTKKKCPCDAIVEHSQKLLTVLPCFIKSDSKATNMDK